MLRPIAVAPGDEAHLRRLFGRLGPQEGAQGVTAGGHRPLLQCTYMDWSGGHIMRIFSLVRLAGQKRPCTVSRGQSTPFAVEPDVPFSFSVLVG